MNRSCRGFQAAPEGEAYADKASYSTTRVAKWFPLTEIEFLSCAAN